jgi:hypothetical protein
MGISLNMGLINGLVKKVLKNRNLGAQIFSLLTELRGEKINQKERRDS